MAFPVFQKKKTKKSHTNRIVHVGIYLEISDFIYAQNFVTFSLAVAELNFQHV